MKQPYGTLNEMHTIIKSTNPNKHELKKHCKQKLTEQQLVTRLTWNGHVAEQHPFIPFCSYTHSSILGDQGVGPKDYAIRLYETTT